MPERWQAETLVMLLAGGHGERLYPLTKRRAKPAVPFGGLYRIIDFTLSNCLNSDLRRIYVLTQHRSLSLDRHLRAAWPILRPELGEFIQPVPPQLHLVSRWYAGTADAVFQNLDLLEEDRPARVLIVSGDHVYRMDYGALLRAHVEREAAVTIAATRAPVREATRMGVLQVGADGRVTGFDEKPSAPRTVPGQPAVALVNMGVYVFDTAALVRALIVDAKQEDSAHDFGRNIIPALVGTQRVVAYDVTEREPRWRYWQDVGTVDSYYEATMDLLQPAAAFDLYDPSWPIRSHGGGHPPAIIRTAGECAARVLDSIVSPGCVVDGGTVLHSVLSPGVRIGCCAVVEHSILMPGVSIGRDAIIRRAIIDENVAVPPGARIGGEAADRSTFTITEGGVAVVPEGLLL